MLRRIARGGAEAASCADANALWFDLEAPTEAEEQEVEAALCVDVPTPAERAAFEESARFYEENGALYLTATFLGRREEGLFVSGAVTFILAQGKLVTVRQIRPRAFDIGQGRSSARVGEAKSGADVLFALLEGAAERLADLLAETTRDTDAISHRVFAEGREPDLPSVLRDLGRIAGLAALCHDSLASLQRLMAYGRAAKDRHGLDENWLDTLTKDAAELERIAEALQPRLSFLQDATLGLINATQTNVLKALSLATMAFIPPTLIASIFGMNFEAMHWFRTGWGPYAAFALMLVAPAALFGVAKWRKWF
jgi:magnesium transporter